MEKGWTGRSTRNGKGGTTNAWENEKPSNIIAKPHSSHKLDSSSVCRFGWSCRYLGTIVYKATAHKSAPGTRGGLVSLERRGQTPIANGGEREAEEDGRHPEEEHDHQGDRVLGVVGDCADAKVPRGGERGGGK